MNRKLTRRSVTAGLALGALASPDWGIGFARAQTKTVKIAMIAPLSGPWARQGQLLRMGSDMAGGGTNSRRGAQTRRRGQSRNLYARSRRAPRKDQKRPP